jgi:hypothetical protein
MKLTELEYSVVMQALQNAQAAHDLGDFVDPYAENEENYTDLDFETALLQAEKKLIEQWINNK